MTFTRLCLARAAVALGAVLALTAALSGAALAQSSIRILVNDEPITSYDISARAQMLRVFSRGQQGEKDAIEQLIDERLMLQEAERRKVVISDAELDAEYANRAQQTKLNPSQFTQALAQAGVEASTFRSFLRANLAWSEIIRARFRATVEVSETDVAAALGKRDPAEGEPEKTYEYRLQQILFVGFTEAQQRSKANAFRAGFKGCDQTLQQAAGIQGVVVKPIVRREERQIAGPVKDEVAKLEIGGISQPQKIDEGIQLVAVCAKTEIPGQTQATDEVRAELANERGQLVARRYLRDLRSDAVIEYR